MNEESGRGKRLWKQDTLLLLNSPNPLYIRGTDVVRAPMFLGFVQGNRLKPYPNTEGIFIRTHPLDYTMEINDVDKFLRSLPAMGGGMPFVRLNLVELVKYEIKDFAFQRSVWSASAGDFVQPYVLAPGLETITVSRLHSNSALVKIKITFLPPCETSFTGRRLPAAGSSHRCL